MTSLFLLISGENILYAVVSALASGGLFAAYNARKKLPSEIGKITIDIAEGAVLVQKTVIEDLRTDILRLKDKVRDVENENVIQRRENEDCERNVKRLEELLEKHNIRIEYIEHTRGRTK